jgi:hypothetical protein
MGSTNHQPSSNPPRCNASKLAGYEASFKHWHFCDLEPGHEGKHPLHELQGGIRSVNKLRPHLRSSGDNTRSQVPKLLFMYTP